MSRQQERDEDVEVLYKGACEFCGSSDGRAVYSDGHSYCFAGCDEDDRWQPPEQTPEEYAEWAASQQYNREAPKRMSKGKGMDVWNFEEHGGSIVDLTKRGLTAETCKKYGYWVGRDNYGKMVQVADYRDEAGIITRQKIRYPDKTFFNTGKHRPEDLFGKHLWNGGKKIVVTEGEIDCMTVSQIQNHKYPVVSIGDGANSAKKTCAANYKFFDQFDEIILMFDMDEPGREATIEAARVLPAGKVKVATLPMKDPNECYLNGETEAIISQIWNAQPWMPEQLVNARDAKELVREELTTIEKGGIPFANFDGLNERTQGMWDGDVVMLTSGSGMGKSTFARQLMWWLYRNTELNLMTIMLEEIFQHTILDIMGLDNNVRLRQTPEIRQAIREDGRFDEWYDNLFDNDRMYLYNGFAESNTDALFEAMRYAVTVNNVKVIMLDHISIIASASDDSDERKMIDKLMTDFKKFAKQYKVVIILICHLKNPKDGKPYNEGRAVSITDLRGSGTLYQIPDTIFAFERNQQGDNPNYVRVRGLKARLMGETGLIDAAVYDKDTGHLVPCDADWQETLASDEECENNDESDF